MECAALPRCCQLVTQHRAAFVSRRVAEDDKKCQVAEAPDLERGPQRSRSPPRDILRPGVFPSEAAAPSLGAAGGLCSVAVLDFAQRCIV